MTETKCCCKKSLLFCISLLSHLTVAKIALTSWTSGQESWGDGGIYIGCSVIYFAEWCFFLIQHHPHCLLCDHIDICVFHSLCFVGRAKGLSLLRRWELCSGVCVVLSITVKINVFPKISRQLCQLKKSFTRFFPRDNLIFCNGATVNLCFQITL